MKDKGVAYMTVPELLADMRKIAEEIELRFMETVGDKARVVCGSTGEPCVWCKVNCEDRWEELT